MDGARVRILESLRGLVDPAGALVLEIDGQRRRFAEPRVFAAALARRSAVTEDSVARFAGFDARRLRGELQSTRHVQQRLLDQLCWCAQSGEAEFDAWREIEHTAFADEHAWLGILRALADQRDLHETYRRIALLHLTRYLGARAVALEQALGVGVAGAEAGAPSLTEARSSGDFERLPVHRAVEVTAQTGMRIPVYLGHQRLHLVATPHGWVLEDGEGLHRALHAGRVRVGRSQDCDVVLSHAPRDVSRHHLIIECTDDEHLLLTDESSFGTYLPRCILPEQRAG